MKAPLWGFFHCALTTMTFNCHVALQTLYDLTILVGCGLNQDVLAQKLDLDLAHDSY